MILRRTRTLGAFGLLLISGWAAAAKLPTQTKASELPPEDPTVAVPLDHAMVRLAHAKTLTVAQRIRKAYEALEAERYPRAMSHLSSVKGDPLFGDYYDGLMAESLLRSAKAKLRRKQWLQAELEAKRAAELLIDIEARHPESRFFKTVPEKEAWAEFIQGDSQASRRKWKEAIESYERGLARISNDKILYYFSSNSAQGYARACVKKTVESCAPWLRKLVDLFPKQSLAGKALDAEIPETFSLKRVDKSERAYERLSMSYKAPDADQAVLDDAIHLYLTQERSKAEDRLKEFLEQFPRSFLRARAKYWMAQIRSKDGKQQNDDTKALYEDILKESPLSFYGLLASLAVARPLDSLYDSTVVPQVVTQENALDAREHLRLRKAEELFRGGALDGARKELGEIVPKALMASEFLAYLAALQHEVGNDVQMFTIENELIQRKYAGAYSSSLLQMIFPTRFEDEIEKQAQALAVDPLMVLSLMKQESGFNADAVSGAGALGLMQLMPFTAVALDESLELSDVTERSQNIRLGTKYLADLFKKYDGNWVYILAAYNAGPSRVDQWKKDARPEWGMLEFIEAIPFRETREYVTSIIRGYVWYSFLTQGKKMVSLEYFWHPQGPQEEKAAGTGKSAAARGFQSLVRRPSSVLH